MARPVPGCWPVTARVAVDGRTITWDQLESEQAPTRDFSSLRFTFDRDQYEAEIDRVLPAEPRASGLE
ncbi:MAG TPA: hypothetical protein VIC83_01870 [Candidatus Limnocylindria bacterium]|jgi:hypothetical protein